VTDGLVTGKQRGGGVFSGGWHLLLLTR
jgi:hypothetical protein